MALNNFKKNWIMQKKEILVMRYLNFNIPEEETSILLFK